jgi:hypothetical protein
MHVRAVSWTSQTDRGPLQGQALGAWSRFRRGSMVAWVAAHDVMRMLVASR